MAFNFFSARNEILSRYSAWFALVFCVKLSWKCCWACGQLKKFFSGSFLAKINDNCLAQLTSWSRPIPVLRSLSLMTYHRELCLFPAIIQIAFGDVNSSRLINHASWDGLTLRMSNVFASPPKGDFFWVSWLETCQELIASFYIIPFSRCYNGA